MNPDSSDTNPMTKQRGGQLKHWAERARILAWYHSVTTRCDWSDYKLDYEFSWTDECVHLRTSDDRPRMFESIRKAARAPAGRDRRWRGMDELVEAVDRHELFHGTKALYEAEIWDLFQNQNPTIMTVLNRVRHLLKSHGLKQVEVHRLTKDVYDLYLKLGPECFYDRCLQTSLRQLDFLNRLALIWLLYVENEAVHNWPIRVVLQSHADRLLDLFFDRFLPEDSFECYGHSIRALLGTRINLEDSTTFGALESYGKCPVLPAELVKLIPIDHPIFVGHGLLVHF